MKALNRIFFLLCLFITLAFFQNCAGEDDDFQGVSRNDQEVEEEECVLDILCVSDEDCPSGSRCNEAYNPPACQKLYCGKKYKSCSANEFCEQDLICHLVSNQCGELLPEGDECELTEECEEGLVCREYTYQKECREPQKEIKESCYHDTDCLSGICWYDICTTACSGTVSRDVCGGINCSNVCVSGDTECEEDGCCEPTTYSARSYFQYEGYCRYE